MIKSRLTHVFAAAEAPPLLPDLVPNVSRNAYASKLKVSPNQSPRACLYELYRSGALHNSTEPPCLAAAKLESVNNGTKLTEGDSLLATGAIAAEC